MAILKKKRSEKLFDLLKRFRLESINLSTNSFGVSLSYTNWDAEAAWILYVELLTRITTQPLLEETGIEKSALDSVYSIFKTSRDVLKNYGKNAKSFSRVAILVLNKILRPFTSKWHLLSENGIFEDENKCLEFRSELEDLRLKLTRYAKLLAEMAEVDDLTELEE
ncbi:MAG: hypothetical protein MJZ34_14825 [Paludibacteraceae bacterium]|nr:hypothetical protein [Paludibacteraceae bacterium]